MILVRVMLFLVVLVLVTTSVGRLGSASVPAHIGNNEKETVVSCVNEETRGGEVTGGCGGADAAEEVVNDGGNDAEVVNDKSPRLILVTAITNTAHANFARLVRTCKYYGVNVTDVGNGETWQGHMQKFLWYRTFVRGVHAALPPGTTIDEEPYVMMSDAHDVVCNNGPESVVSAMQSHFKNAKVVFSGELTQFPRNDSLWPLYIRLWEESPNPAAQLSWFKFLNAGAYMGKPSHLMECLFSSDPLMDFQPPGGDDQAYLAQLFLQVHKKCNWEIDFGQKIFGSTAHSYLGNDIVLLRHEAFHAEVLRLGAGLTSEYRYLGYHDGHVEGGAENHATSSKRWFNSSHLEMKLVTQRPFHMHGPGIEAMNHLEYYANFFASNDGWSPERQRQAALEVETHGEQGVYVKRFKTNFHLSQQNLVPLRHPDIDNICLSIVDIDHDPDATAMINDTGVSDEDGGECVDAMLEALANQNLDGISTLNVVIVSHRTSFAERVREKVISRFSGVNRTVHVSTVMDQLKAILHCDHEDKTTFIKVDSVSVLTNPNSLQWLLSHNVPMVAPMLTIPGVNHSKPWSANFWLNDTRPIQNVQTEFRPAVGDEKIKSGAWRHMWAVRALQHTYVIREFPLRELAKMTRKVESDENYVDIIVRHHKDWFDFEISRRVRETSTMRMSIFLDNTIQFGHLTQNCPTYKLRDWNEWGEPVQPDEL
eukprot:TRINITY_DN2307_c0_g1_i2.p1 TRINITY_DN2307_c0_g1~~TRINITY_DN2307_c0_g1_i2.p1  ORF type:complete len:707 (-),score=57.37 TRINITY_DN2307_c0_g1_i2:1404-3524(-)